MKKLEDYKLDAEYRPEMKNRIIHLEKEIEELNEKIKTIEFYVYSNIPVLMEKTATKRGCEKD